jgi:hypothetical protein
MPSMPRSSLKNRIDPLRNSDLVLSSPFLPDFFRQ